MIFEEPVPSMPIHYKRYKGYVTIVQQDAEAQIWHGRVLGIPDVITFEAQTDTAAEQEFRESVDAYLSFCETLGRPAHRSDVQLLQEPT